MGGTGVKRGLSAGRRGTRLVGAQAEGDLYKNGEKAVEGSLRSAARRATIRRVRENRAAPVGMTSAKMAVGMTGGERTVGEGGGKKQVPRVAPS